MRMSKRILKTIFWFACDKRGNVMILAGLLTVPLLMMAGAAVDMSQVITVRTRLAQAADAAALAVGAAGTLDQSQAQEIANNVFNANYPAAELGTPGTVSVQFDDGAINVSADAVVDMAILDVIGINTFNVGAETVVIREVKNIEVVMVLDNTGSMSGSKIESLKTAAETLVNVLFGESATSDNVKIGLVPFATSVNIGPDSVLQGWVDTTGTSSLNEVNFDTGTSIFDLYQDLAASNVSWAGCVEARPEPYDTNDAAPQPSIPDTRWVPYLWPDEPDSYESGVPFYYYNSYLNDTISGNPDERQRFVGKYDDGQTLQISNRGPNWLCPTEITPMTNVKVEIMDAIDDMYANGSTNIPVGLAWGMRAISPGAPYSQGASYTDDETIKAIILLTDGANWVGGLNNHNGSYFTAYNFLQHGRLNTQNANAAVNKLNQKTSELCTTIKGNDVQLFTLTFQVSSNSIKDLMRDCASTEEMYFNSPSQSDLINVFGVIAKQLSNLRISQ